MSTKLKTFYAYLVLTIAYAAGTLIFVPTKQTLQKYHLTVQHLRVIDVTVVVLFAAIWFCAAYAFYNFRQYYHVIQKTKEGKPLNNITKGVGFLVFWFPITGVFGLYTNELMMKHVNLTGPIIILQNYLSLLIPLAGFLFISFGARKLSEIVRQRPTMMGTNVLVIVLISIGATYIYTCLPAAIAKKATHITYRTRYFWLLWPFRTYICGLSASCQPMRFSCTA